MLPYETINSSFLVVKKFTNALLRVCELDKAEAKAEDFCASSSLLIRQSIDSNIFSPPQLGAAETLKMLTPYAATIDGLPHDALGRIVLPGSSEEDTEMDELDEINKVDETNKLDEINKLNESNNISSHFARLPNEIWDMVSIYLQKPLAI